MCIRDRLGLFRALVHERRAAQLENNGVRFRHCLCGGGAAAAVLAGVKVQIEIEIEIETETETETETKIARKKRSPIL